MSHRSIAGNSERSRLQTLTFTTLYPNERTPHHGVFVEQRLRKLVASGEVATRVIAPVPWFPVRHPVFGRYAQFAAVPNRETRHEINIVHPKFPMIPKIGMSSAPVLLAGAVYRLMRRFAEDETGFDLIDAHYFYPDGVAAAMLGIRLNKPFVITARGTDINLIPKHRIPRRWITWAASRCSKVITVSDALRNEVISLGVQPQKVKTLRNGVDLEFFHPIRGRDSIRRKLGFDGLTLLSVGHLIERKGHHFVIESLLELPDARLIIVGEGPMRDSLKKMSNRLGVGNRVDFRGAVAQEQLVEYYNAADALVLASSREGMANVLLESIACGTPVIATPIWGSPEVVADSRAGILMDDRSARSVVRAVKKLAEVIPSRDHVRAYAMQFGWNDTTRGQLEVFRAAIGKA